MQIIIKQIAETLSEARLLLLLVLLLALGVAPVRADFVIPTQGSTTVKSCLASNNVTCITISTNLPGSMLITNAVGVRKHIAIGCVFNGVATNTGVVGVPFYPTYAGTNNIKGTTPLFTATFTATGSNAVAGYYVVPDYTLGPCDGLVAGAITNAANNVSGTLTGGITMSNLWVQFNP